MKSHRIHAGMITAICLALLMVSGCGDDDDTVCPKPVTIPETCVALMDDAWTEAVESADPTEFYGDYGLTFDNTAGYGLIGGEGNGDSGNWNIEGTNGSAAWGLWGGDHSIALPPSTNVSVDFLRGHNDGSFTVTASFEGTEVGTESVTLVGAYDSETVLFPGPVDLLEWSNGCCFGLDDLRYTVTGTDCPPAFEMGASARYDRLEDAGEVNSRAR